MRYAFGDCVLDTALHELRRTGVPVKLQRKVYQGLAYLVEQRARLVTKEELLDRLWPGVYMEDYAVARAIAAARRAVGDSRTAQRVIRTLYGQGYRFIAAVVANGSEPSAAEASQVAELPLPAPPIVQTTVRVSEHKRITVLCCRWSLSAALASYVDLDGLHEMQQAVEALVQRAEAQPERLAHHVTEAGLHAQAVSYWLRAGQRAVERSAHSVLVK